MNKLIDTRYGKMLINENDNCIGQSLLHEGEWYQSEMDLLKIFIKPGDICVDVGANQGCHSLMFAQATGPSGGVIAFEPQNAMFQLLCANAALNNHYNIISYNMAVGKTAGTLFVPPVDYSKNGNFGAVSMYTDATKGYPVTMTTLDDKIHAKIHMIKIDVEGFESDVIRGARKVLKHFRPFIYAENNRVEKSLELINLIKANKYNVYQHLAAGWNPNNFNKCIDNKLHKNYLESNIFCVPEEKKLTIHLPQL